MFRRCYQMSKRNQVIWFMRNHIVRASSILSWTLFCNDLANERVERAVITRRPPPEPPPIIEWYHSGAFIYCGRVSGRFRVSHTRLWTVKLLLYLQLFDVFFYTKLTSQSSDRGWGSGWGWAGSRSAPGSVLMIHWIRLARKTGP